MRLEFNVTTGMAQELEGVHVRVPGFGNTETIEWCLLGKFEFFGQPPADQPYF